MYFCTSQRHILADSRGVTLGADQRELGKERVSERQRERGGKRQRHIIGERRGVTLGADQRELGKDREKERVRERQREREN